LDTIRPRPLVFDSSFLMAVAEHPTPWQGGLHEALGAYTPVLLSSVRDELAGLVAAGGKRGRLASLAMSLAAGFVAERDGGGRPDDEIASFALKSKAAVATVDRDLARALRAARVGEVMTLRSGRVARF
jgi:rRNA-processing protein FCF1